MGKTKMSSMLYFTYDLGTFLEPDEEVLGDFLDLGVGGNAAGLVHHTATILALPIDAALNFTLKVARVLAWEQRHFDVAVRVRLQLTLHWLKEEFIATDKTKKKRC